MAKLRRYSVVGWRLARADRFGLTFRPTFRIFLRRLVATALVLVFAWMVFAAIGLVNNAQRDAARNHTLETTRLQGTRPRIPAELDPSRQMAERQREAQRAALEQREARLAALDAKYAQQRFVLAIIVRVLIAMLLLLAMVAVFLPVSCAWNFVTLGINPRRELFVQRWRLLLSTRGWPQSGFQNLHVLAQEVVKRDQHGNRRLLGWFWSVQLYPGDGLGARDRYADTLDLRLARQKNRPFQTDPLPEPVKTVVAWLESTTGLKCGPTLILEHSGQSSRSRFTRSTTTVQSSSTVTRHEASSLDRLPAHIRSKVELALASSEHAPTFDETAGDHVTVRREITFLDKEGRRHTYRSPEEMPPEVRKIYEEMHRSPNDKR